jgi:hypothetical protein
MIWKISQEGAGESHPTSLVPGIGSEPIAKADTAGDFAAHTGRDVESRRNFRKNVNRGVLKQKGQAS